MRQYRFLAVQGEFFENAVRAFGCLKDRFQFRLAVKIEFDTIIEVSTAECFHDPGFPCLACARQQDGLAVGSVFPLFEGVQYLSFNFHSS